MSAERCSVASWCMGMRAALAGSQENDNRLGLHVSRGWLGDEPRPRLIGVTFRPRRGPAIVLNVCPWCGARIRFDEVKPSTAATPEQP